ncbi:hypothetical protein [Streptomyces triticisoli]|uniref:hypothetical protein n=1 Tax=Streptomyces triticisoli TaxID=2182797 RepID=UPI000DD855A0
MLGGGAVAVEAPGLPFHHGTARRGGGSVVPMRVGENRACARDLGEERAVVVTPAHHHPTGASPY